MVEEKLDKIRDLLRAMVSEQDRQVDLIRDYIKRADALIKRLDAMEAHRRAKVGTVPIARLEERLEAIERDVRLTNDHLGHRLMQLSKEVYDLKHNR